LLDKGAERGRVNEQGIAVELGPTARLDINPTEGVLGEVYGGLKQATMGAHPGAAEVSAGFIARCGARGQAKAGDGAPA